MPTLWLYLLVSPFMWGFVWLVGFTFSKGRLRNHAERLIWDEAVRLYNARDPQRKVLIFHAASAGEFEQLKPLLPKIDRTRFFILQTFYSHTIYVKAKDSELFDACCYHPLDSLFSAQKLFRTFKPVAYVVNRHDLWPAHLFVASHHMCATFLINANFHSKSLRTFPLIKGLNRWMFNSFHTITCGSSRIAQRIEQLAPQAKVQVLGETRFERVLDRARENHYTHFSPTLSPRKNIVLGSIIPSDYEALFGGLSSFLATRSDPSVYRIIAVPHEVDEASVVQLEQRCARAGFTSERYVGLGYTGEAMVLIVNTVGILAELYGYGHVAYVGAGFGAGVHSVIEPAAYGIPVFFGPHFHILDEAVEMVENGSGTVITTSDEVATFLLSCEESLHYTELCVATKKFVAAIDSCSEQLAQLITSSVNHPPQGVC